MVLLILRLLTCSPTPLPQPYTFTLYESDGTTAVAPDPFTQATATDLPVATGLDAGTYFVTVTNALTCQSGQTQVIVGTNTTAPALTITEVAPNGTCAGATNPVGSLQVTVDNDDTEAYTYQWYVGSGTGTPVVDGVNANGSNVPAGEPQMATISGLVEGVYTVVVTDNESTASAGLGCSASATFTLSKDTPTYTVNAASTTHIQHCTVDDTGVYEVTDVSVNGTPTGGVAGFTFKFFDNLGTELTTGNPASVTVTGANISGLTPGNYSVEITNTATNCSSANIPFEIQDNSQAPVLSITVDQNNTSCGAANGSLTVNITNDDAGTYSYTWYNGNNLSDTSSPLGQTTATATGLDNGDYWVLVTDTSDPNNTCSAKIAGTIIDDPADLSVDAATAVATDQCNPQNGSITITQMTEDGTTYTAATDMQPYTFTLYESDGTTAVAPDPFTQATATDLPVATGLDAGTYFVTVTNALTCQSGQTQVIVGTNTTAPALTITEVAPNGTCAGATNPVGSLQVTVDNDDSEDYTYQWYVGSGTGTPVVDGVNANGSNVPAGEPQMETISGLVEGVYTVVVTDNESTASAGLGCSASATFTLSKDTPTYTVNAASTTHIQHCTVDDTGVYEVTDVSVNGTPTGGVAGFTFKFFDNLGTELTTGNPASVTVTGANISGLTPGNYSVEITNTATNCSSANIPFEIQDNSQAPVLSITVDQNNTSCGAANGSLTANIVFNDGGTYSYTWYNGNNLSDTSSPLGQTTATATGLDNGDYWVLVTDTSDPNNTCSAKIAGTIIDDPADLSVDAATAVATDQCNPQNGSITITQMTEDGTTYTAATDMQPYTFTLYESDGTTAVAPDPFTQATATDLPVATGLDAGTYFVTVTNALTCQSGQTQVIVGTNTTAPALTITEVAPNGTCAGATNPVGSLQVTVDNDDSEDYTYQWYVGSGTGTPVVDGVNANGSNVPAGEPQMETISGLVEGVYTVVVTDNESTASAGLGCSASATFTLSKDTPTYTVNAASTTHIQHCTVDDTGVYEVTDVSVNGTPTGGVAGFTFKFFDNLGTELTTGNPASVTVTGANISGLTPGNYSVEITNTTTNCSSANIPFEIQDNSQAPVLSITVDQNNTSCGAANGSLTANIVFNDGGTYSYTWYNGNNLSDTSSPLGQTTATATGLDNGDYWVLVTDTSDPNNTCSAKIAGTIIDDPADITINASTQANVTKCAADNGQITITELVVNGTTLTAEADIDDYTFALYDNTNTLIRPFDNPGTPGSFPSTNADLAAGTYYVVATEAAATACSSVAYQVDIDDVSESPVLVTAELAANSNCTGTPNGSAQVTITGGSGTYTYAWYEGNDLNNTASAVNVANGGNTATITNMAAGFYWVLVTDNDATAPDNEGCSSRELVEITENLETITIAAVDFAKVDNTNCSPFNGQATVNQITSNGTGLGAGTFAGYEFVWYNSDGSVVAPANTTNTRNDLAPGNYQVTAKNTTSGCESAPVSFTINDNSTTPDLATDIVVVNSTSCNVSTFANGSMTVDPDGTGSPNDGTYSYQWYTGSVAGGTPLAGATNAQTGLAPGVYSVQVTNTTTGCESSIQRTITQEETVDPEIASFTTGTVTSCTTPDGTATANAVLDGVAVNPTDYNWYWFSDADATTPLVAGGGITITDNVVTGLSENTYSVYLENKNTGCKSDVSQVEITRDPSIDITINIFQTQPGTCNGATGELRIEATDPSGVHQFTFEVYKGESDLSATPDLIASSVDDAGDAAGVIDNGNTPFGQGNGADDDDGVTDYEVENLINDTYTIVATDQSTGCTERRVFVLFWADVQRVDVDPIVREHSTNCKPYNDGAGGATGESDVTLRIPALNISNQDNYQLFLYQSTNIDPEPDMTIGTKNWETADGRPSSIQRIAGTLTGATLDLTTDTYINHGAIGGPGNGIFEVGETITGGTSGAEGTITEIVGSRLRITITNATAFTPPETITTLGTDNDNATANDFLADKLNDYTFTGLTAGVYAVVAAEEDENFCYSPPVTFEIEDRTDEIEVETVGIDGSDGFPNDDDVEIVSNMDCTGSATSGTGSITINRLKRGTDEDTGPALGANYNYVWHEGPTTGSDLMGTNITPATNDGYEITGLPGGQYLVEVSKINSANGDEELCETTFVFTVPNVPPTYTIVSHTVQHVDDCATQDNGSITLLNVDVGSGSEPFLGLTGTYDFLLYEGNVLINGGAPDDPTFTGLDAGTYTLYIQNETSLCLSDPYYVEIEDNHVDPDLTDFNITPNTGCEGSTDARNGSIRVNNIGDQVTNVTIQWLIGDVNSVNTVPAGNITSSNDDTQIDNMPGGTYTLVVTDNTDPNNGCSTFASYVIPDNTVGVTSFAGTKTDAQDCTIPSNGEIEITSVTQTNGTITNQATIDGVFDFIVYNEDFSSSSVETTHTISNLNPGTYYVVAENQTSKCQSDPVQFVIDDVSANPALSFTIDSDNTTCSTASGEVTVNIASASGTYTYDWFVGGDVSDEGTPFANGSVPSAQTTGVGTDNVSGLPAGTYWVKVTDTANPSNTCVSKGVVTIEDETGTITLNASTQITITDASDCAGANATGQIEVTDVSVNGVAQGGTAGFTFEFFDNANVSESTANPFASVAPGDYFVVATSSTTGCSSDPIQVTVGTTADNPDITLAATDNTACDAANYNGTVTATINDLGARTNADYTFTWYNGGQPVTGPARTETGNTLSDLEPGLYSVVITANSPTGVGCSSTATVEVIDNPSEFTISSTAISHISDCADIGQIEVNGMIIDGAAETTQRTVIDNYTFTIYDSNMANPAAFTNAGTPTNYPSVTGLAAGTYFITATLDAAGLNCESAPVQITINDNAITPNLTVSQAQPNSNCDLANANGSLTVAINNQDAGTYTYQWYSGTINNTASPLVDGALVSGATTATVSGLAEGNYWVQVTDTQSTGDQCAAAAAIYLNSQFSTITLNASTQITITDASDCAGANATGQIEVTDVSVNGVAQGGTAGFTFEFFDNANVSESTANPFASVAPGDYFVVATSSTTGCSSDPIQVTVGTTADNPDITLAATDNTACDAANYNGTVTATINDLGARTNADYTFTWYNGGQPVTGPARTETGNTLSDLEPGLYSVVITANSPTGVGCSSTATVEVIDNPSEFTISSTAISHISDCADIGQIEVNGMIIDGAAETTQRTVIDNYTFTIYDSNMANPAAFTNAGTPTNYPSVTGLAAGTYFITATLDAAGLNCESAPVQITINDNAITPNLTVSQAQPNSNCDLANANGSLTVAINNQDAGTYTYQWYSGTINNTASPLVDGALVSGATTATVSGLAEGNYWVQVTDTQSTGDQCAAAAAIYLNSQFSTITLNASTQITITDASDCAGANATGQIEVTDVSVNGVAQGGTAGFTFEFFDNANVSESTANPFASVAPGDYFVVATSSTTGCSSDPIQVTVGTTADNPDITLAATDNTACDAANYNGTVTATINDLGARTNADYTFTWYNGGQPVTGPARTETGNTLSDLEPGLYSVVITANSPTGVGCSSTATVEVIDNPSEFTISSTAISHISDCADIGQIEVNGMIIDGAAETTQRTVIDNYTFTIYDSNMANPAAFTNAGTPTNYPSVTGLAAGTYFITATLDAAGLNCESAPVQITINDNAITPNLTVSQAQPNSNCDLANANGSLTVAINNQDAGTYTYQWYSGTINNTASPLVDGALVSGATTATVSGLAEGNYWVQVTDTQSTGDQCAAAAAIYLNSQFSTITLNASTQITITDASDCAGANATGQIEVTDVSVNGVAQGGTAGFTFEFFDNANVSESTANPFASVAPGDYFVVATSSTTGCSSDPIQVTVGTTADNPDITLAATDNTACDAANYNGTVTATINDLGARTNADYTFTWYNGGQPVTGPARTETGNTLSDLEPGLYSVVITANSPTGVGCSSTATVEVIDNPSEFTISSTAISHISDCADIGQIEVNGMIIDGAAETTQRTVIDNYTFTIYDSNMANPAAFTNAGTPTNYPSVTGLAAGTYFITATLDAAGLNCESAPVQITINDNAITPNLTVSQAQPNSNCDLANANGSLTVAINNQDAGTYTYQWYSGTINNTASPLVDGALVSGATTATVSGLAEGNYWVQVTDTQSTGDQCAAAAAIYLNSQFSTITLNASTQITITDASDCAGANATGQIEVTDVSVNGVAQGGTAGFTFEFFDNANVSESTANPFASVAPGDYFVVATSSTTGCSSDPIQVTVGTTADNPDITLAATDNTACDAANYNGTVTATINDLGARTNADYTFTWYNGGQPVTGPARTETGNTLSDLEPGLYSVVITANSPTGVGCSSTATVEVIDNPSEFTISSTAISHISDCADIGQIEVNGMIIDGAAETTQRTVIDNYTFTIYDSNMANPAAFTNAGTPTNYPSVTGLAAGTYFITATLDAAGLNCESAPVQITINDNAITPNLTVSQAQPNSNCDLANANGSLTVAINNQDAGTYTYQWYSGTINNTASPLVDGALVSGATTATVSGLAEGNYWVQVTDTQSTGDQCAAAAAIYLNSQFSTITLNASTQITITDASDCAGANATGQIEVTDVSVNGVAQGGTAGFTFEFFAEGDINNSVSTSNPYANVTPGDYFVVATSSTTGCSSSPVQVTVGQDDNPPVLIFTENSPNTACNAANYNGSLSVAVSDGAGGTRDASEFTFQWYEGDQPIVGSTVDNADGGNTHTISTVAGGTYSVVVTTTTGLGTGCSTIGTSTISSDKPVLKVTGADIVASNSCNPDENGSIEITALTVNGGTFNSESAIDDFTFELFDASFASLGAFDTPGTATNFPSTSGLSAGDYYVVGTNVNGCTTSPYLVRIEDSSSTPTLELNMELADNSCNGTDATGSLSVTVVGGTISDYTIEWFVGDRSVYGITAVNPANISTSGNKSIISGVAAGEYSVGVTDNTVPGKNCMTIASGVITNNFAEITITEIALTANQNCVPPYNGSVIGEQVTVNGTELSPTATAANYTFTYFDSDLNPVADNTVLQGGTYYVVAENNTTGCTSEATLATVANDLDNLAIDFSTSPNTYCAGAGSYNGSITATVTYNNNTLTGRFSFDWYEGNTAGVGSISSGISSGATDNISTVSNLESKQYTVVVTDNTTGCTITRTHTVPEALEIPELAIPNARLVGSTLCTPGVGNGSITLTNADISPGNLSDYDFDWYLSAPPGATFDTQLGTDGDVGQQSNLQAGDYYVVATNRTTGCSSAPARFDIQDISTVPVLEFSQTSDIGCGTSLGLGSITALADGFQSSNAPAGYSWQWYQGASTTFPAVSNADGGQTSTISNQSFGTYTVEVTNANTGCSIVQRVVLEKEERYPVVVSSSAGSQTTCTPNGTVAITGVSYDGTQEALSNFTFSWTNGAGAPLGNGASPATSGTLPAGSYFVSVTHNATGCTAPQLTEVVVLEEIVLPVITITQDSPDTNCTAATGTGQLSATADGGFTADPPYTFEWFNGSSATGTAFATGPVVSNLSAGTYTVRVSNSNTGCNTTKSYELESEPVKPKIVSVETTGVSVCNTGNGEVNVTAIQPDNLTSYTYELFDVNPSTAGAVAIANSNNGQFTGVNVGTFWVVAEHITTGCLAKAVQVEVEDISISPVIAQESIDLQTNCDPAVPNGAMTVSGDGSTDQAQYSFEWYAGTLPVSGNPADVISNTPEATGLAAGIYSVVVTDLSTGCSSAESFKMADDIEDPILISTSFEANNNCVNPDGELGMFVINAQSNKTYEYYWFVGNVTNPDINNADYTGVAVIGVPNGTYTAYVVDVTGGCTSDPVVVEVPDNTNTSELQFDLIQEEPLTNCDPSRPNAIVNIQHTVPSGKSNSQLTFYWYTGNTTDPANRIDETVSTYTRGELTATTYTVEMIDETTGCSISKSITVEDQTQNAPTPLFTVVSDRTNCSTPNGEALITSDILEYTFEWTYNGAFFGTGTKFNNLDVGEYTIVATDIKTGCTSNAATFNIADNTVQDPAFEILVTQDPVCDINNGEVETIGLEEIDSIAWSIVNTVEPGFSAGLYSNDRKLIEAPPGDYSVYVRDGFGCDNTIQFSLSTDIIIYNGVSANGDGQNDIFLIDCAEFFPNNKCQIFNRAGQLVYEIDNYDNTTNVFIGESNKGVSVGKEGLPEGTYFYIFDKGDGSDVHQGYLELVR